MSRTGRIIARVAKTLPKNAELADLLELLADLLELDGADAFRLAAYRKAATRIREAAVPVAQLALEGKATKLSGIGTTIENKIVEYTETGDLAALAKIRDRLPTGLVEVMHVPGLGPKTARKLWTELGVTSAEDLRGGRGTGAAERAARSWQEDRGEGARRARQAEGEGRAAGAPRACPSRRRAGGRGAP